MAGVAELEGHGAAFPRLVDTERQRRPQPLDRLVERQSGGGRLRRQAGCRRRHARHRPPTPLRRSGARARRAGLARRPAPARLRGREPREGGAPPCAKPRGGRTPPGAPARVRIGTPSPRPGASTTRPLRTASSTASSSAALLEPGSAAYGVELELAADQRAELEHLAGRRCDAGQSLCHDVTHRLRRRDVAERTRETNRRRAHLDRLRLDQLAPELGQEEGVPGGQVDDRLGHLAVGLGTGHEAHELCNLAVVEAREPQAHDTLRPHDVRDRLRHGRRPIGLRVADRRDEEHAGVGPGAHEMPDEEQRGNVGPVHVLEHEQHRRSRTDRGQQLGDGRVQAMPLGVGVGADLRREGADDTEQLGEQTRQLAASRPEIVAELHRIRVAHEVVERLDERPVRRGHDRVAGAVEDERAFGGEPLGQLPHQPALARPRLAGHERHPAPLAACARQERAQRRRARASVPRTETRGRGAEVPEVRSPGPSVVRSDHVAPRRGKKSRSARVMTASDQRPTFPWTSKPRRSM